MFHTVWARNATKQQGMLSTKGYGSATLNCWQKLEYHVCAEAHVLCKSLLNTNSCKDGGCSPVEVNSVVKGVHCHGYFDEVTQECPTGLHYFGCMVEKGN